jgi:Na+-transporting NADH:ubiquinone oxidoreductase subunit F
MTLPLLRRLHKWVAIIVGVQVLLWCISGAMFAWLDHHEVRGMHLAEPPPPAPIPADLALAEPRAFVAAAAHEVRLQRVGDRWVYRVATEAGTRLHDATSGAPVQIDAPTARRIALELYRGEGALLDVVRHDEPTLETRKHGAAWAAHFDDELGTTLWLAADDGRLLETRTDAWRLFDLFWMLHTMDYAGRDDFNHPLVILFASSALWVALTGFWLVVRVFRKPRPAT